MLSFVDLVKGIEKIWYFGEKFGSRSFEQYFKLKIGATDASFSYKFFEVSGFMNNRFMSLDVNAFSRLCNLMAKAISEQIYLPKMVVIMPDDDIIMQINEGKYLLGMTKEYEKAINWIMSEHSKIITAHKEKLPAKAKKEHLPHIIWIEAPRHVNFSNNFLRDKFNLALQVAAKLNQDVSVMQLKKVWDKRNMSLFIKESNRFTAEGLQTYWEVVDHMVKFADSTILKRIANMEIKKPFNNDKYHWSAYEARQDYQHKKLSVKSQVFKKLPALHYR